MKERQDPSGQVCHEVVSREKTNGEGQCSRKEAFGLARDYIPEK